MKWLRLLLLLPFAVLGALPPMQPPDPPQREASPPATMPRGEIRAAPLASDAIHAALADAVPHILSGESRFLRYLWVPSDDEEHFKATVLGLNYVSRASFVVRPEAISAGGAGTLIRVYLPQWAPRESDTSDWIKLWDEFAFDPHFSQLLTKDVIQTANLVGPQPEQPAQQIDVIRTDDPTLDTRALTALRTVTQSQAPITHYQYFLFRALSTVKDDGPFRTIFGGLYYDLRGIKKAKDTVGKESATDEDLFFENLGVGSIAANETFERVLDRGRGDLRPTMFISGVTGKPRAVVGFHTPAEREGQSWGAITLDIRDKDVDVKSHPALSQLKPVVAAKEAIFPTASGMPIYALFNGQGALQDEAPPDVVADRAIPAPYTTRLQGAISCVRCHRQDGWQDLRDDVGTLLRTGRVNVLADFRDVASGRDSQDRIIGLHTGNANRLIARARDDFAATVLACTGPWKRLAGRQEGVAAAAADKIASLYNSWWYEPVNAYRVLFENGLIVKPTQAAEVLTKLLEAGDPPDGFESIRIAQLAAGGTITRADWSLEKGFLSPRIQAGIAVMVKGAKK